MPRLKAIPKTDAAWNIRFRGMLEYLKASYSYDVTKSCGTFGSFVGRNPDTGVVKGEALCGSLTALLWA